MEAKEAPEKIYLQQYDEDTLICLNEWNISEEWTDKPCNEKIAANIEYTRTDSFIEKACKFLQEEVLDDYSGIVWEGIIKDFKNYMKGE